MYLSLQILMSVPVMLITVTQMLSVQTPLVASPVPVAWATVEMDKPVWVSIVLSIYIDENLTYKLLQILMSVPLISVT